jgi:branched-chain amino acid transport system ATP-binding protein
MDKLGSEFSYGEQRLLSLACLLMGEDNILLLDEPTSGVNPRYISLIGQLIRRMVNEKGISVLMIEHNMHFVREIADDCAFLSDGIIAKYGITDDVLNDPNVRSSYLGL